jgi:probable addiction module antidote protein
VKVKLTDYNGTNFLKTREDIDEYLMATFESGDPKLITRALGNIAKAQNLSAMARETGLNRIGLYRSLSKKGDPKVSTFFKIISHFGYQLTITPKK